MVVDDFNVKTVAVLPAETDAPLIVDPDAPLTGAVASELFEPVARWDAEEVEGGGTVELLQLALGDPLNILRKSGRKATMKEFFRFLAGE